LFNQDLLLLKTLALTEKLIELDDEMLIG
jgi:hypothetical protein